MKPRFFLFVTVYLSLCYLNIQVAKGLSASDNPFMMPPLPQTVSIHKEQLNGKPDVILDKLKKEKNRVMVEKQCNYLITFGGSVLLVLLLGMIIYYSRLMAQKNRQIRERDQLAEQLIQMTLRCEQLTQSVPQTIRHVETLRATSLQTVNMQQQQLVYRLQKHILDNKNNWGFDIDRNELVIALSTNRTTLSETAKTVTGKTLMAYINLLRLEKAKQMLDKYPGWDLLSKRLPKSADSTTAHSTVFSKNATISALQNTVRRQAHVTKIRFMRFSTSRIFYVTTSLNF